MPAGWRITVLLGLAIGAFAGLAQSAVAEGPIAIVAAENFYGDIARQIGGSDVVVTSILNNPVEDPHEFEAAPSTARAVSEARLIILNGAGYDPWMEALVKASKSAASTVIVVADLIGRHSGDNPHIWYDPETMPAVAAVLAKNLAALDPAHRGDYNLRLAKVTASFAPIAAKIAAIKAKFAGLPVAATEPVFGDMAKALGFDMRDKEFQWAVMNGTEPSVGDVARLQHDLATGAVKLFFYNSSVNDEISQRMRAIAVAAKVPIIGVSETMPPSQSYQEWITGELDAVAAALEGNRS
jgi:zinc/manganese transport system substrate-binding protein